MASKISREAWIQLYRQLQREANQLESFNFRQFFHRRIRDHFEKNRSVTDPQKLQELFKEGQRNVEVLRRQAVIEKLYPHQKTFVEDQVEQVLKSTQH